MARNGVPKKDAQDTEASEAAHDPFAVVRQAAQSAISAPFELANRAMATQQSLLEEWRRNLTGLSQQNAVFKTRIQKGGRVSIPDAEREALGLQEGDLVQVILIPLTPPKKTDR